MDVERYRPLTVSEYLRRPECKDKEELVFGFVVREPVPSFYDHGIAVTGLTSKLHDHLQQRQLGVVGQGNVILDQTRALVLVPDLVVVLNDRLHYVGKHLTGPPNMAIEVRSPSTAKYDRDYKREWYRTYGVQEYWIVDAKQVQIEVIDLTADPASDTAAQCYAGDDVLCSARLPDFRPRVRDLLDENIRTAIDQELQKEPPDSEWRRNFHRNLPRRKPTKGDRG